MVAKTSKMFNKLLQLVQDVAAQDGEYNMAVTVKGDYTYILRNQDLGNGYLESKVYQLPNDFGRHVVEVLGFGGGNSIDDGQIDEFWTHLDDNHALVTFGE